MKEVYQYRIVQDDEDGYDKGAWADIYNGEEEAIGAFGHNSVIEFRVVKRGTCGTCGTVNVTFPVSN